MINKLLATVCTIFVFALPAQAQLNTTFSTLFDAVLVEGFALSPGAHGQHFLPAAAEANSALTPALNSLIASNISSFPISTTAAGITFDFSSGQPVSILESQGPVFAEIAETLGERRFMVGFNATHLSLNKIRGLPLDEMRFTFLHEDLDSPGLGDNPNESDIVNIFLGLDVDANVFTLFGTFGVTRNLDVSIAIPFVDIQMRGTSRSTVQSFTLGALGEANHHFGNNARQPLLTKEEAYDQSTAGVGDIALRFKMRLPVQAFGLGTLVDVRVPTGDEVNFLGTGSVSVRGMLLASKKFGDFRPHLNAGYDYRGAAFDSDEIEVSVGFDQKVIEGLTFALDFLGEFDLQKGEAIKLLPGTVTITDQNTTTGAESQRLVSRSNIPDSNHDHTMNAAIGFRVAPSERLQFLGNLLVPLQDGGLRSSVAPTVGFSLTF